MVGLFFLFLPTMGRQGIFALKASVFINQHDVVFSLLPKMGHFEIIPSEHYL
jgi:hypothetical protein